MGLLSSISDRDQFEAAVLDVLGRHLGPRIWKAVEAAAKEAVAAAPNWRASLEHLESYVRQQVSGLASKTNSLESRVHQLEVLVAQQHLGQPVEVTANADP